MVAGAAADDAAVRKGTPDKFAKTVLAGVARNKETIAPGFASLLWAAHRYTPGLTGAMSRSMLSKLEAIRT